MSKILLINGSPHPNGCTYTALREAADAMEACGLETEIFWIGKAPVQGCTDCGYCSKNGKCVFDDMVNALANRMDEFDGVVVGSPVYYGAASGQLCSMLDRLFFSGSAKMAFKPAAAVVSCRRGGASAAFDRLNKYFALNNMPLVTSQYWNQVHGFTPDEVRRDEEGLQTMRALGRNMAWMVKCIAAGKQAGIDHPELEDRIMTNFIMD